MDASEELIYAGSNFFRMRICYSVLSGRPVNIRNIRENDDCPGIRDYEAKFLSLMEKLTNGTKIVIGTTGTEVSFRPGMITGGCVTLNCGSERCLSYFLEPLVLISPFCKQAMRVKLNGVTNAPGELSVDALRASWLPVYSRFVLNNESLEIKVQARGLKPDGGGTVIFTAPIVRTLRPIIGSAPGKICKIRGLAYVTKVSPSLGHRVIDAAKKALRNYISDVYITVDQRKGDAGGSSPGYGLFLWAETTEGVVYTGEAMSRPKGSNEDPFVPEEVGQRAAYALLEEVYRGGCCDSSAQVLVSSFMTLGDKDVSKFLMGPLSTYTVNCLRHLKSFFHIVFKIEDYSTTDAGRNETNKAMRIGESHKAFLTCMGIGYKNLNKVYI